MGASVCTNCLSTKDLYEFFLFKDASGKYHPHDHCNSCRMSYPAFWGIYSKNNQDIKVLRDKKN